MSNSISCPSCGAKIKDGAFGSNFLTTNIKREFIAEVMGTPERQGCSKCQAEEYDAAVVKLNELRSDLRAKIKEEIAFIPIVTTHSPFNWDYKILGIATGQSTTGTGIVAEIASSWTDFFGLQSETYNRKIAQGESLCSDQLRAKAVQMGGNAIIAVDIDYSELGGGKGMIMVCMSGTVVKLNNTEVVSERVTSAIKVISECVGKIESWNDKYAELMQGQN